MFKEIEKAIINREKLEMIYMSESGIITQRQIRPFKITKHYFQAYCYLRQSTRTFKVSKVLACSPSVKQHHTSLQYN